MVKITWIGTENMIAISLTKVLDSQKMEKCGHVNSNGFELMPIALEGGVLRLVMIHLRPPFVPSLRCMVSTVTMVLT